MTRTFLVAVRVDFAAASPFLDVAVLKDSLCAALAHSTAGEAILDALGESSEGVALDLLGELVPPELEL